jgi:hypothetical protein
MKAAFFALFTLAASALASPLLADKRQLETQADEIDKLTELVKVHTANISMSSCPSLLSARLHRLPLSFPNAPSKIFANRKVKETSLHVATLTSPNP